MQVVFMGHTQKGEKMKYLLVLLLSGCAIASRTYDEKGEKTVSISCNGAAVPMSVCYNKANEVCPGGYFLVARNGQSVGNVTTVNQYAGSSVPFVMKDITVRCK